MYFFVINFYFLLFIYRIEFDLDIILSSIFEDSDIVLFFYLLCSEGDIIVFMVRNSVFYLFLRGIYSEDIMILKMRWRFFFFVSDSDKSKNKIDNNNMEKEWFKFWIWMDWSMSFGNWFNLRLLKVKIFLDNLSLENLVCCVCLEYLDRFWFENYLNSFVILKFNYVR